MYEACIYTLMVSKLSTYTAQGNAFNSITFGENLIALRLIRHAYRLEQIFFR